MIKKPYAHCPHGRETRITLLKDGSRAVRWHTDNGSECKVDKKKARPAALECWGDSAPLRGKR